MHIRQTTCTQVCIDSLVIFIHCCIKKLTQSLEVPCLVFSAHSICCLTKSPVRANVLYIPYDQLNDTMGPLSRLQPNETTIIMFETSHKGTRRRYHKQKLAILLSNNRHFALEQAKRGVQVLYRCGKDDYGTMLSNIQQEFSIPEIQVMRPAEREFAKS